MVYTASRENARVRTYDEKSEKRTLYPRHELNFFLSFPYLSVPEPEERLPARPKPPSHRPIDPSIVYQLFALLIALRNPNLDRLWVIRNTYVLV